MKTCSKCKILKSFENFSNDKSRSDFKCPQCKDCQHELYRIRLQKEPNFGKLAGKLHRTRYPDGELKRHFIRKYGITPQQYNDLLIKQDYKCILCSKTKEQNLRGRDLFVDHDHKTNRVRGLVCFDCNLMLGHARDNIKTLEKAIEYLKSDSLIKEI